MVWILEVQLTFVDSLESQATKNCQVFFVDLEGILGRFSAVFLVLAKEYTTRQLFVKLCLARRNVTARFIENKADKRGIEGVVTRSWRLSFPIFAIRNAAISSSSSRKNVKLR